ncbi:MAG TPA: hypothetical protein VM901_05885 [Bdellovibrionota bacterium]|jgi:hypothetical protein|nr:hypothetical protein [Bdellovibrionota bacterium]
MRLRHLALYSLTLIAARLEAYPQFIGYGYTSCQVCHFNAFGNGPLTDYGRAVGASAISSNMFSSSSDEALAEASGFLGKKKLPDWFRPAVGFRSLLLMSEIQSDQSHMRYIPMQMDASATFISPNQNHWASVTIGYMPARGLNPKTEDRMPLISREHYISTRLAENWRVMGGMMDVPYGIRIPDHTSHSRSQTQLAQNDQSHMIALHQFGEKYEIALAALAGNLFQEADLRQKGASLMAEYDLYEKVRIGHSHLYTKNAYRSRLMNAVHARIGAGEGSAVLFEAGTVLQRSEIPQSTLGAYVMFENMIRAARGLHFVVAGEVSTNDTRAGAPRVFRLGPGLQWFLMNRVEWRTDLHLKRTSDAPTVEQDTVNFLTQIHLWL